MDSQSSATDTAVDQGIQASLSSASIIIMLTAFPQGEWEQKVNERELRYLKLLEQRIQILERNTKAPGNDQSSRRTRRTRRPSPRHTQRVGQAGQNNQGALLNCQQIPSSDSGSDSGSIFNSSDISASDVSAPYRARKRSRRRRKYAYVKESGANSNASSVLEIRPTALEEGVSQDGETQINLERVLFEPRCRVISPVKNGREGVSYAFRWITHVDLENDSVEHEAVILEGDLKRALADELQDYPVHFNPGEVSFGRYFDVFIYAWDRLEMIAAGSKPEVSAETQQDLKALLSLIQEDEGLKGYFNNRSLDSRSGAIAYGDLWTMFSPGTVIYASPMDYPQAFLVHDWQYKQPRHARGNFVVLCWAYDFDGDKFNRVRANFLIPTYLGKKAINSLPCYPLEAHEDCHAMSTILIKRGSTFRELCTKSKGNQMFNYKGEITFTHSHEEAQTFLNICVEFARNRRQGYDKEEMVGSRVRKAQCDCIYCRGNVKLRNRLKTHYDGVGLGEDGHWPKFEDVQLMNCQTRLRAYALAKKTWVELDVDSVQTVQEGKVENALDHLCLADDEDSYSTKRMIQSLVLAHTIRGEEERRGTPDQLQDFVEGKGRGLVILLHGTSGVGKTLTAESIAKATGKPLLKVSIADIGTDVTKVEQKLDMMFQLATAWEAILLFDEADILLEARAIEDNLVRNAVVSVFLKILEYYEGILFLTTNRIKTFDIAVQSRVNLGVHFEDMGEKQQKRLLTTFIEMVDERQIKNKGRILEWIGEDFRDRFNGREIRNMLSSAMALARANGRPLELSDIKVMRESKKRFKEYLQEQTILAKQRNE